MKWRSFLNPDDISTLTKSPESLSPIELFLHVRFLRATGQEADAYALALWRKAGGGTDDNRNAIVFDTLCFRIGKGGFGQ